MYFPEWLRTLRSIACWSVLGGWLLGLGFGQEAYAITGSLLLNPSWLRGAKVSFSATCCECRLVSSPPKFCSAHPNTEGELQAAEWCIGILRWWSRRDEDCHCDGLCIRRLWSSDQGFGYRLNQSFDCLVVYGQYKPASRRDWCLGRLEGHIGLRACVLGLQVR